MSDIADAGPYPEPFPELGRQVEPFMTLRDYFAAHALPALITRYEHVPEGKVTVIFAKAAYEYADAMLAERAK